ncbi:MAG: hypothetical protein AAF557_26200 [Pseudomonadota bacterium]
MSIYTNTSFFHTQATSPEGMIRHVAKQLVYEKPSAIVARVFLVYSAATLRH